MAGTVLALWALATAAAHLPFASTTEGQPQVRYVITNLAGARASDVSAAAAEAERAFARIGVRLRREDPSSVARAHGRAASCESVLLVFLVGEETVRRATADREIVGFTIASSPGEPPVAMVAFDRVSSIADAIGIPRARMLGTTLAHELGHLLRPRSNHSRMGVMKGTWSTADVRQFGRRPPFFTRGDADAIRERLEQKRSSPQQCPGPRPRHSRIE